MNLQEWADVGQVVSGAATVVILFQFWKQILKDRAEQEHSAKALTQALQQISYETYMRANERYLDYLEICLQNPALDIFELTDHLPLKSQDEHPRQQLIAYAILMGTLEHGFVCSVDQDDDLGKKQHSDWLWYMDEWAKRETFRKMWKKMKEGYDQEFIAMMDIFCKRAEEGKMQESEP